MKLSSLFFAVLLACTCGACSCPCQAIEPTGSPLAKLPDAEAQGLEWKQWEDDPGRYYLYRGRELLGGWDTLGRYWRAYRSSSETWGPVELPPVAPPGDPGEEINFGVDWDKVEREPRYRLHRDGVTRIVTSDGAKEAIEAKIEDDSGKLRVTVIGTEAERKRVRQELEDERSLRSWAIVRDYPADHWAIKTAGFHTGGTPTIYCQAPSGKVLHRQDDYAGGAPATLDALRKAKDGYDRKRDPDLRTPSSPFAPAGSGLARLLGLILSAIGGVFGGEWLAKKNQP